jgi:hypothetical protein
VLTPLLKGVTGPESGFDLVTVNVDEYPELAGEFKVTALPTVVAFKDGNVKNKFSKWSTSSALTTQSASGARPTLRSSLACFRGICTYVMNEIEQVDGVCVSHVSVAEWL